MFALVRVGVILIAAAPATAAVTGFLPNQPQRVRHRITGLFSPARVDDLRETFERLPDVKLISVDYDSAEAVVEYVPAKAFPGAKNPDEIVKQFDNKLRSVSYGTFGVKPLLSVPKEKLERIEIGIIGHECKGCCLATYEAVYKLDGVERVTVSFKEGHVIALVDPEKANRARLEEALMKRGVRLKPR
jgi:copper chaperone CopZ